MRAWQRNPKVINARHSAPKKYTSITINIVSQKNSHLSSPVFPNTCVCACVPTKAHLYMHTFIYIKCNFCALTCLLSM